MSSSSTAARYRRPPRSLRPATLLGIALLAGWGSSACGPAASAPGHDHGPSAALDRGLDYLLLRLGERRLYLMDGDTSTPVESFPIAIGRNGHDTPTGRFRVEEMVEHPDFHVIDPNDRSRVVKRIPPGPANPLGERWIAFAHGDGWTIGIHGTPQPELLGRAVSKGCIRMRNDDVIRLYDRVRIGTPVVVEP